MAGRYLLYQYLTQYRQVSIHARPDGRAILSAHADRTHRGAVSIHARPDGRAIRGLRCAIVQVQKFQSTPDQMAGRYGAIRSDIRNMHVSIHARPDGRAIRVHGDLPRSDSSVSIHARPDGRAIQQSDGGPDDLRMFQSTPDQMAGRYPVRRRVPPR